jgi:hypothetical protein
VEEHVFAGGFLVRLRCDAPIVSGHAKVDRPEWTTLEHLAIGTGPDLATLLPRMPLLRSLHVGNDAALESLAGTRPYPGIRAVGCGQWLPPTRALFPDLEVLGGRWVLHGTSTERIADVARAVRDLGVTTIVHLSPPRGRIAEILAARAEGPPELRLLINATDKDFYSPGWRARIFRDIPRAEITLHQYSQLPQLRTALETHGIKDVTIVEDIDLTA